MDEQAKLNQEENDETTNTDTAESESSQKNEKENSVSDFMKDPDVIAYIEKQIAEGLKKALQGTPPKANTKDPTEQERKSFEKMTYKERLSLFKQNPQAYQKLAKGAK